MSQDQTFRSARLPPSDADIAAFNEKLLQPQNLAIEDAAKSLGVSARRLIKKLLELEWVYRLPPLGHLNPANGALRSEHLFLQSMVLRRRGVDICHSRLTITPKGMDHLSGVFQCNRESAGPM